MRSIQFMTSLLTFYLKGEISQDDKFIKMKKPNTILALIPLGAKKESVPVSQLASVDSNFKLHLKSLLVCYYLLLLLILEYYMLISGSISKIKI